MRGEGQKRRKKRKRKNEEKKNVKEREKRWGGKAKHPICGGGKVAS